jgi:peroxiredoxin
MKMWSRLFAVISILCLFPAVACGQQENNGDSASQEESGPVVGTRVGNIAPDFGMQSSDGNGLYLSDMKGTPVLLNFWATWCGPCVGEMPLLQRIYDESDKENLFFLCINVRESPEQVGQFMEEKDLSLPVMLDTQGSVSNSYGITASYYLFHR